MKPTVLFILSVLLSGVLHSQSPAAPPRLPEPPIDILQAVATGERAMADNGFDVSEYMVTRASWIRHPQYFREISGRELQEVFKSFGGGPFWMVQFHLRDWEPESGDYYNLGRTVLIFGTNRVAIIDRFVRSELDPPGE